MSEHKYGEPWTVKSRSDGGLGGYYTLVANDERVLVELYDGVTGGEAGTQNRIAEERYYTQRRMGRAALCMNFCAGVSDEMLRGHDFDALRSALEKEALRQHPDDPWKKALDEFVAVGILRADVRTKIERRMAEIRKTLEGEGEAKE